MVMETGNPCRTGIIRAILPEAGAAGAAAAPSLSAQTPLDLQTAIIGRATHTALRSGIFAHPTIGERTHLSAEGHAHRPAAVM
jgi:hypothetical protein